MQKISYLIRYRGYITVLLLILLKYLFLKNIDINTGLGDFLEIWKEGMYERSLEDFSSPQAELLMGMVLGLDRFYNVPSFNDVLISTGTIHVVVVSGFNLSLVFIFINKLLGSIYKKINFILSILFAVIYSIISGMEPPIVRALFMMFVVSGHKFLGKKMHIYDILFLSAMLILLFDIELLSSLSLHLSFLATFGLMLFADKIKKFIDSVLIPDFIIEDFSATLAAQVFVTPLIYFTFGRVSFISPVVNAVTLWCIPYITILGYLYIFSVLLVPNLSYIISNLIAPLLGFFIYTVLSFSYDV